VYQVKPAEEAVFRAGQIDKVDANVPLECGCPAPPPIEQTEPATAVAVAKMPDKVTLGAGAQTAGSDPPNESAPVASASPDSIRTLSNGPETRPVPGVKPDEMHVQVDVPFVFTAKDLAPSVPPAPLDDTRALPVEDSSVRPVHLDAVVEAPRPNRDAHSKAERHGFFHRLKGLIQTIFG
jgi:hypothetical protein